MGYNRVVGFTISCDIGDCESETSIFWHEGDASDSARDSGWEEVEDGIFHCPKCCGREKKGKKHDKV